MPRGRLECGRCQLAAHSVQHGPFFGTQEDAQGAGGQLGRHAFRQQCQAGSDFGRSNRVEAVRFAELTQLFDAGFAGFFGDLLEDFTDSGFSAKFRQFRGHRFGTLPLDLAGKELGGFFGRRAHEDAFLRARHGRWDCDQECRAQQHDPTAETSHGWASLRAR